MHAIGRLLVVVVLAGALGLSLGCGRTVGETIDDSTINTRVKTALLNDPDVGGLGINVSVFKGVVTLSGRVRSEAEQAKAVEISRKVSGVEDVRSTLQVIP